MCVNNSCNFPQMLQDHVRKTIENAEKAIHMINQLSLFSSNEEIEEISTNQLRYYFYMHLPVV